MSRKEGRRKKVDEQWLETLFELFGVCNDADLGKLAQKEKGFGRYIFAARKNAGIPLRELANITEIPFDKLVEIEIGEFPIELIEDAWVDSLAEALGEDVDDLNLILGRFEPGGIWSGAGSDEEKEETVNKAANVIVDLIGNEECEFQAVVHACRENNVSPEFLLHVVYSLDTKYGEQHTLSISRSKGWLKRLWEGKDKLKRIRHHV